MKKKVTCIALCLILVMSLGFSGAVSVFAGTNSFTKTGNMAQDIVNAALAQQGKKVSDFSGMPKDNWCAYFICWCAQASGAADAGILPKKYSDCSTTGKPAYWVAKKKTGHVYLLPNKDSSEKDRGEAEMKSNAPGGNWSVVSRSGFTPKAGDIVLFRWKNASSSTTWSHVGLVYEVSSSNIKYVDGNGVANKTVTSSYVSTHTLKRSSTEIVGYIRPAYTGGGTVTPPASALSIKTNGYENLKNTSVRLKGTCGYSGTRPSSVGVYLGLSQSTMSKKDSDDINHSKNPFDIWYDISGLTPGTTYYWKLYANVAGKTIWSDVKSFKTPGSAPATPELSYSLTFQSNGGTAFASVTKPKGTVISLSTYVPTRQGYTFGGWCTDVGCSSRVTSVTLNSNMKIYAQWREKSGEQKPTDNVCGFHDVQWNSRYADAVEYVYENGLMNGVAEGTFKPYGSLSRAMIVTILYRQEGSPYASGSGFRDVPSNQYYSAAVAWASENGIVNGYIDGSFRPNDAVSMQEMLTIFYRYAQKKSMKTDGYTNLNSYRDGSRVGSYAQTAFQWALANKLMIPLSTYLYPTEDADRGEAAIALKALNQL